MIDIDYAFFVERKWGSWTLLDKGNGFKVKRLIIHPNQSISMQYHNHRAETWCILDGFGKAQVAERTFDIRKHTSFYIPIGVTHKVWNTSSTHNLVIIEVQQGEIVQEDDIVRLGQPT
jgi:mannose-6-phosphate isomerase-like protein (cupin superfamily)